MIFSLIIPAGGIGSRLNSKTPKQYLPLKGKAIIIHTIEKFLDIENLNEIVIAIHPEMQEYFKNLLVDNGLKGKNILLVDSGESRQESVFNCLEHIKNSSHVLIHDSVRPFVSKDLILNLLDSLKDNDSVIPAIPVKDTIKKVENSIITNTPERSDLFAAQTPQGFKLDLIKKANDYVNSNNLKVTDDASIVEAYGEEVKIIIGDPKNIKITDSLDLQISELLL